MDTKRVKTLELRCCCPIIHERNELCRCTSIEQGRDKGDEGDEVMVMM